MIPENGDNLVRPPAVSGFFYPADKDELSEIITAYMQDTAPMETPPKAIIAPHAGYIYSGSVAASAYATLAKNYGLINRVILLGPAHRVYFRGLAYSSAKYFSTPLGKILIDQTAIESIANLPQVILSDEAHAREHSLEVHLPFLQSLLKDFTLVPLVVGDTRPDEVAEVLNILWGNEETLIVISSDLSHYHDYETARKLDKQTSELIESLDFSAINSKRACGCMPIRGLLKIAREKSMRMETVELKNSGDTAGPHDRVVGYGAYALTRG